MRERYRPAAATNPADYAYIACHRRTKGATRPRPCVYRRGGGRGARKGMFYNEPKQRRALTSAAGTNGVGRSARAGASRSPFPETAARERSCGINRGLGEGANSPPPPGGASARARATSSVDRLPIVAQVRVGWRNKIGAAHIGSCR